MSSEFVAKYVGHKVSKVRWKPQPPGSVQASNLFVSGSWDEEVNRICLWQFPPSPSSSSSSSFSSSFLLQSEAPDDTSAIREPALLFEREVNSSVTGLQFVNERRFAAGFADGSVNVFSLGLQSTSLDVAHAWPRLHRVGADRAAPCSAVGVGGGPVLVTGGEDGRLCLLPLEGGPPIRCIDSADSGTITALACTLHSEVMTASSSGQLKLWDLRLPSNRPARTLVISEEYVAMQSLARHPHQPHLVAVGRGDGSLCFWDLRHEKQPPCIVQAHSSDVWEVHFHASYPSHLFTCGHDGALYHWNTSPHLDSTSLAGQTTGAAPRSPSPSGQEDSLVLSRLSAAVAQGKVNILHYVPSNRLSMNSLDVESRHVVCGSDSGTLFVVPNLTLT